MHIECAIFMCVTAILNYTRYLMVYPIYLINFAAFSTLKHVLFSAYISKRVFITFFYIKQSLHSCASLAARIRRNFYCHMSHDGHIEWMRRRRRRRGDAEEDEAKNRFALNKVQLFFHRKSAASSIGIKMSKKK